MSKLLLFDFGCTNPECGEVFEELVPSDQQSCQCVKCNSEAQRQISNVRLDWRNMGTDADFATCADKWAKMQYQKSRKEDSYNLVMY